MGGERRSAHADHARFANGCQKLRGIVRIAHGQQGCIPLVQGVVFDDDGVHAPAAGRNAGLNGFDNARNRRMHRRADIAVRRGDLLSHQHRRARLNHGLGRRARMLQ